MIEIRASRLHQVCPCLGWLVHVSYSLSAFCPHSSILRTSWEFVLNLDYEYSIIMGKRRLTCVFPVRYHWTAIRRWKADTSLSFTWDVVGALCSPSHLIS